MTIFKCATRVRAARMETWLGQHSQERPIPGDHGIRFEPVAGAKVTRPRVPTRKLNSSSGLPRQGGKAAIGASPLPWVYSVVQAA